MGPAYLVEEDAQPDIKRARTEEGELYDPWIPTDEAISWRSEPSHLIHPHQSRFQIRL